MFAQTTVSARLVEINSTLIVVVGITLALLVLFGIFVSMRPDRFQVERQAVMLAPAGAVFAEVNDFRRWREWSPWAKIDPAMTVEYSGPAAGQGASYHWVGNKRVGEGRMTILESRAAELVRIDLEFLKPFAARHVAEFVFEPIAGDAASGGAAQTRVTWHMTGRNNFLFKVMQLFMSMDKMVGKDFEKGLAQMKQIVEARAVGNA